MFLTAPLISALLAFQPPSSPDTPSPEGSLPSTPSPTATDKDEERTVEEDEIPDDKDRKSTGNNEKSIDKDKKSLDKDKKSIGEDEKSTDKDESRIPAFLPLVSLAGTTDKEGELKASPSLYVSPKSGRLGLLISPFITASTTRGAVEVPLANAVDTPGLGFGGSLSFYGLYASSSTEGISCGPDDSSPWSKHYCEALSSAIATCDRDVGWDADKKSGTNCGAANESYCKHRKDLDPSWKAALLKQHLCEVGRVSLRTWLDKQSPFLEHEKRQDPRYVVALGAAAQPATHKYLLEGDTSWTRQEARAWTVNAGLTGAFVLPHGQWRERIPLTLEVTAAYIGKSTPSTTTGKWCFSADNPIMDGDMTAPIETCSESPLGAPTRAHRLEANLLVGGIDSKDRRYRFAFGPTMAVAPYQSYFVGVEAPFQIRLTPDAWPSNYRGAYSGFIRIRPVIGALGTSTGVSLRALVVLELLAIRSLFGDRAFSWL